ncbi:magnesium/cobalt transporter CorA [Flammeovirga pacifica]|uniref:Magnesium transport protein CorA n=1 Tax=Flammeovirga pacifica TaxID=915059 RepID=A0A1S1YT14_FLAPC|nr:magnesium/cobalt transporter CorA [Flammeovirga pacifica]OHX64167.1 magnesium and cobalt transport protein CorA [Flammeovirga pacifica]
MIKFSLLKQKTIGKSPEDLVFVGEKKTNDVVVTLRDFGPDHFHEQNIKTVEEAREYVDSDSVTWINFNGIHDVPLIEQLKDNKINPHILSDVIDTTARPKFQEYDNAFLITMKILGYNKKERKLNEEHFSLVLYKNCVLTFKETDEDLFRPLIQRIKIGRKKIKGSNVDYLIFNLLDIIVDHSVNAIREISEEIDEFENILLSNQKMEIIDEIISYKKVVNNFRKNIKPILEMFNQLNKYQPLFIEKKNKAYFNELLNNTKQASEIADSYREILSDQLNIYHTTISSKLNSVMMTLTIFSVIFIPLTFIAGIYGTNFDNIPELHYQYGYYSMWFIMIIITIFMLFYFKKKKWLA